jgi:hypothetical protein
MITTDLHSLKLHVAEGRVWYLHGNGAPHPADTVEECLESAAIDSAECIRVMGVKDNARLIVGLYEKHILGNLGALEVVTPLVCETAAERRDPTVVLYRMRRFQRAPSLGGYHAVGAHDYAAYQLTAAMDDHGWTPATQTILRRHPAWFPLKFIPEVDWECCAKVLAAIIDPRWYIDACHPDRSGKLEAFLGLNPKTQAGVTRGTHKWRKHTMCETVLRCWKLRRLIDAVRDKFDLAGPRPYADSDEPGLRPGDFPWRIWGSLMGIGPGSRCPRQDPVVADLRASQRFVQFVRLVWLHALYTRAVMPEQGAPLFDAKQFFRLHVAEAQAFNHYMWDTGI